MIALRRNVLLFHQAALGDFVVTWPIAMAAARLWPTNRTIYVTTGDRGALAERAIGVEWRDVEPTHGLFGDGEVPEATRKLLAGATLVISFVSDGSDTWAKNVRRLCGPDVPVICVNPRPATDEHVMAYHAGQLGEAPQLQAAVGQMIRHVAASGAVARRAGAGTVDVLIHPGSGGAAKCWPIERFVEMAKSLKAAKRSVAFAVGEAERERWPAEAFDAMRSVGTIHEPTSAIALFDLLRTARAYVGNDSGPTHLAALAGVPTLALFGTNATQWRPIGPSVSVIERSPLEALPAGEVLPIVEAMLEQSTLPANTIADED